MTGLSMVRMISHVGVRLMVRLGAKADRPHDCRIKAAACGSVGRLKEARQISDLEAMCPLHPSLHIRKTL